MSLLRRFFLRCSAKGTTTEGDVTSTNVDANTQAVDVSVKGSLPLPTGAATGAKQDTIISQLTTIDNSVDDVENKLDNVILVENAILSELQVNTAKESKQDSQISQLTTIISNTTGLSLQATQLLVKGVLDTIKLDTAKLDVLLSTRNAEATQLLIKTAIDSINTKTTGLNLEVTQLLVKSVLDLIKAKTDNIDVALSTRATEATLLTRLGKTDFEARINTLGQKTMANSTPVVIASDQIISVTSNPADPTIQTYSAAIAGLVIPLLATDIFNILGSATKIIKIRRVLISGTTSAGSGISVNMLLIKRSTANTGGVFTTLTNIPNDSNNAAATAVVKSYTTNPTLGTAVGNVLAQRITINTTGALDGNYMYQFGNNNEQPIVLRGVAQSLSINLSAITITNPLIAIHIEWTEE